jgi:hypothetical protein
VLVLLQLQPELQEATMFPLIAIAGVISAVASAAKGASWLSDKVNPTGTAAASGGKTGVKPPTDAKVSPFEATLAAQAAGQTLPGSSTGTVVATRPMTSPMVPPIHGTDYDSLARMQAGLTAYGQIGQHHGNHAGSAKPPGAEDGKPITWP